MRSIAGMSALVAEAAPASPRATIVTMTARVRLESMVLPGRSPAPTAGNGGRGGHEAASPGRCIGRTGCPNRVEMPAGPRGRDSRASQTATSRLRGPRGQPKPRGLTSPAPRPILGRVDVSHGCAGRKRPCGVVARPSLVGPGSAGIVPEYFSVERFPRVLPATRSGSLPAQSLAAGSGGSGFVGRASAPSVFGSHFSRL